MRYLLLAALLLFPAAAQARVVVGESCTQIGTSTMTTDQQSIATCLKDKSGSLVWKSMTGGSSGALCGLAYGAANAMTSVAPCQGEVIFTQTVDRWGKITKTSSNCPSGYIFKNAVTGVGTKSVHKGPTDSDYYETSSFNYNIYTCVGE